MNEQQHKTAQQLMELIQRVNTDPSLLHAQASFKSELENLPTTKFVTHRTKAPISALRKFNSELEKYGNDPLRMKDIEGYTIVVDSNEDVDATIAYFQQNYVDSQHPSSRTLYHDYRYDDFRADKGLESHSTPEAIDPPSSKGYQTSDGYKNVRVNLLLNGVPTEIQIKTVEQYIAHLSTHDPIYKAPGLVQQDKKQEYDTRTDISGKLFPYFEALAHYQLHKHEMTPEELVQNRHDINEIYRRNLPCFRANPEVFHDACTAYAVYSFMLRNRKDIYAQSILTDTVLDRKLIECEVERVFKYTNKLNQRHFPGLTEQQAFLKTIQDVSDMNYPEFTSIRDGIAGEFRLDACVLTGVFDLIRQSDIDLISRFKQNFRQVQVGVYSDELVELATGKPPMFTQEQRMATLDQMKNVSNTSLVDQDTEITLETPITPLPIDDPTKKPHAIGYLPGVFDMLHPGHVQYIQKASELCDKLYVGLKSDNYVRIIKHKEPVLHDTERTAVISSLRTVDEVFQTDRDILPPKTLLDTMQGKANEGESVAIFCGSDWINHPERKGPRSLAELEHLQNNYPDITLTSIPRDEQNNTQSSSNYRQEGLARLEDNNSVEATFFGG